MDEKKSRINWTQEELDLVLQRAYRVWQHVDDEVPNTHILDQAQREILHDNRWLSLAPLRPSGSVGKAFVTYLNIHEDEAVPARTLDGRVKQLEMEQLKLEPLKIVKDDAPVAEHVVKTTPAEKPLDVRLPEPLPIPVEEIDVSGLVFHMKAIASVLARSIAQQVIEEVTKTVQTVAREIAPPAVKAPEKKKKVLVLGVEQRKVPQYRSMYPQLDLRILPIDDVSRLKSISKTFAGPVVIMAGLVSHTVTDLFKDSHDLWRVNSFAELQETLNLLGSED
jgi:hypothetical protein